MIGAKAWYRNHGYVVAKAIIWGRGAFWTGRRHTVRSAGLSRSENVGISSDMRGENPLRRKSKVSLSNVRRLRVSRS
jgi:hypothetical protein